MNGSDDGDPRSSFILHRSSLVAGVDQFNAGQFYEAHESWEGPWLTLTGDPRLFLQGLIQLAAAYHHVQRGTYRGGVRLFDAAMEKLAKFPDGYAGIDRSEAIVAARKHRERIARGERIDTSELPKLR